ncbi:hypothetical protein [Streptomyces sp. NPDC052721]|uniref:hypothetical protein n=1 Tax=Streptomyces sp. NPDC052721 TaxID=3154955 RepID=UPI0034171D84
MGAGSGEPVGHTGAVERAVRAGPGEAVVRAESSEPVGHTGAAKLAVRGRAAEPVGHP